MPLPTLQWLRIVEYRGFHDIPRSILALDRNLEFWIFDSAFDDAIDDYPETLHVYRIGHDAAIARDTFRVRNVAGDIHGFTAIDTVSLSRFEFDPTRRASMFIHPVSAPERAAPP